METLEEINLEAEAIKNKAKVIMEELNKAQVVPNKDLMIIALRTEAMQNLLTVLDPSGLLRAMYEREFHRCQLHALEEILSQAPEIKAQMAQAQAQEWMAQQAAAKAAGLPSPNGPNGKPKIVLPPN